MRVFECILRDKRKTVEARSPTSAAKKAFGTNYSMHWEEVDDKSGVEIVDVATGRIVFVDLVDHG